MTDEMVEKIKKDVKTANENEIEYLRDQLKKQTKTNTKLNKQLKGFKKIQTSILSVEAPYVHVKIMKILGGKGKKGEISVSAGGSIEKINTDDVEAFSEVLLQKINEKIDYALQELQKEETE